MTERPATTICRAHYRVQANGKPGPAGAGCDRCPLAEPCHAPIVGQLTHAAIDAHVARMDAAARAVRP